MDEPRQRRRWFSHAKTLAKDPGFILTLRRVGAPCLAFVLTLILGAQLGIGEMFAEWASHNEEWEVDELPVAFLAAAVSFGVLAALERRRYQEEVERHRATAKKLRQAVETAIAANRSKSAFLASLSHELRTPLNAIVGFSDFMRRETLGEILPSQYSAYVQDIHNSSENMLLMIEKILDISKIEAGKYDLRREPVQLAHIVEEATRVVNTIAVQKNVEVRFDISQELEVFADPQAIRQIMINLLSNAVKFNRFNGRVTVKANRDPDRSVAIAISDTGHGINSQMLAHVFEPFAQISPYHARPTDGCGLGLSIVKHLAELHGGTVAIDSEPDHGTLVLLRMPDRDRRRS